MNTTKGFLSLGLMILTLSCADSSSDNNSISEPSIPAAKELIYDFSNSTNLEIPDNSNSNSYKILLFGNSHISGISHILEKLITANSSNIAVALNSSSSQLYLKERLYDGVSPTTLASDNWTHVIFQAQKYSQSGAVDYPIDGTKKWLQLAKEQNTTPILFPEHPQRGNLNEGRMVHNLHVRIAKQESSCVAPIGLTWDKVLLLRPELNLYASDGNHASYAGRVLSALVFYQVITGKSADLLPFIDSIDLEPATQDFLGQMASEMLAERPACAY